MKLQEILLERTVARKSEQYARRLLSWFLDSDPTYLKNQQHRNALTNLFNMIKNDFDFEKRQVAFKVPAGVVNEDEFALVFEFDPMAMSNSTGAFVGSNDQLENIIGIMGFDPEIEEDLDTEEDLINEMKDKLEFMMPQIYPVIVHEMTHYIDKNEIDMTIDRSEVSMDDYFNSEHEFRAYMVQAISKFESDSEEKIEQLLKEDFDVFVWLFGNNYLHAEFSRHMSEENKEKMKQELWKVYTELRREKGLE